MRNIKKILLIIIWMLFIWLNSVFAGYEDILKYENILDSLFTHSELSTKIKTEKLSDALADFEDQIPEKKKPLAEWLKMLIRYKLEYFDLNIDTKYIEIPYYIEKTWLKIYKANKKYEFVKNNKIYRIDFSKYFWIDNDNYKYFIGNSDFNNAIIIATSSGYKVVNDYKIEEKLPLYKLSDYAKWFVNKDEPFLLIWKNYYALDFSYYYSFREAYNWFYPSDKIWGKKINDLVFLLNENRELIYTASYSLNKIIWGDFIKNILTHRNYIISLLSERVWYYSNAINTEDVMWRIQKKTLELIKNKKTDEQKIKEIYGFILEHYTYDSAWLARGYKPVFSAIWTYDSQKWVCDAYTRLFVYMLGFAGISDDIEIKSGYVLKEEVYDDYSHAWVKIWDYYYDPTFDDPIGNTKTREEEDWLYYKLPEELIYAARINWTNVSNSVKNMTYAQRTKYIEKRYFDLLSNENYKDYNLLQPFLVMKESWIEPWEKITIDKLKNAISYWEYNGVELVIDWEKRPPVFIKYYEIKDDFSNFLESVQATNKDLDDLVLIKWRKNNWISEYRLVYEMTKA